jgi:hypothetical protein
MAMRWLSPQRSSMHLCQPSKEAEILRRWRRPAMTAMIAGINRIASASKCLGKPGISAGMLDEAMRDLHHRLRHSFPLKF